LIFIILAHSCDSILEHTFHILIWKPMVLEELQTISDNKACCILMRGVDLFKNKKGCE